MSTYQFTERDKVRFMRRFTVSPDGCWRWDNPNRSGDATGYGQFSYGGKGGWNRPAHRVAHELFKGPIPTGLQVDHVCHTEAVLLGTCLGGPGCQHRSCVNPDHLEAVTPRENTMRGVTLPMMNAAKTHCSRGHEFNEHNTSISSTNRRVCRPCKVINQQAYLARRAAA